VSGLDYTINEEILYAAFIPFGDIREITIPRDGAKSLCCCYYS
jgi:RNA recognition motif-containing protein